MDMQNKMNDNSDTLADIDFRPTAMQTQSIEAPTRPTRFACISCATFEQENN